MSFNGFAGEAGKYAETIVKEVRMLGRARAAVEEVRSLGRAIGEGVRLNQAFIREARMLGHDSVGDEDLLLGILRVDNGVASRALSSLGVTYEAVREQSGKLRPDAPDPTGVSREGTRHGTGGAFEGRSPDERRIPFSPAAQRALDRNVAEARRVGDYPRMTSEHILLGILRNTDGTAARILSALDAPVDAVEERLDQLRGRTSSN